MSQLELAYMADDEANDAQDQQPLTAPPKKRARAKQVAGRGSHPQKEDEAAKSKASKSRRPKKRTKTAKPDKPGRRTRTVRPYPQVAFSQATKLGEAIHLFAAGERVRRLTLLEKLNLSPSSSGTLNLINNSNKYKITSGSYVAEWLELTADGKTACDHNAPPRERLQCRFTLAIKGVQPFWALYESYFAKKLPAKEVMHDLLNATDLQNLDVAECVDIFITNLKDLGLLRPIAGSETVIPIEQALDEAGTAAKPASEQVGSRSNGASAAAVGTHWDTICFYIAPIGDPGTEIRKHSDLFQSQIVEPAMETLNLKVLRADDVGTPGMITAAVIEHIKHARMVVADLSMLNPNVFYELALRMLADCLSCRSNGNATSCHLT